MRHLIEYIEYKSLLEAFEGLSTTMDSTACMYVDTQYTLKCVDRVTKDKT